MAKRLPGGAALCWAVIAVVVALTLSWLQPQRPGNCAFEPESCYYSDSYIAARAQFRQRAATLGAVLVTLPVYELPTVEDGLTIDIAILRGTSAMEDGPLLLHFAGVHGVEGHAGSAVQNAIMDDLIRGGRAAGGEIQVGSEITLVMVHAVNPFGFHFGRRTNEENVDLNRNVVFDRDHLAELVAPNSPTNVRYDTVAPNMTSAWSSASDALLLLRLAAGVVNPGFAASKRALATGQYHRPDHGFYGGSRVQTSHRKLLAFFQSHLASHKHVLLLDVHTGLGPSGFDSVLGAASQRELLEQVFGTPSENDEFPFHYSLMGGDEGASAGYQDMVGSTSEYLRSIPGWQQGLAATQEFGTWPGFIMAYNLFRENALWHYGSAWGGRADAHGEADAGAQRANSIRDAFYVQTSAWQRAIVRRGVRAASQALDALTKPSVLSVMPASSEAGWSQRRSPAQR
eukprot:NODE_8192_length_1515_cov_7.245677.p1 GENE.NODE_8192_length_1515_cov_7.245677~~NODE_8192_length_1515_cov_7.245677.p1  ORF type:complete len:457 (+),score=103.06 NODE_8192_length_1515_cov_7.245677:87-1457(+)